MKVVNGGEARSYDVAVDFFRTNPSESKVKVITIRHSWLEMTDGKFDPCSRDYYYYGSTRYEIVYVNLPSFWSKEVTKVGNRESTKFIQEGFEIAVTNYWDV